MRSEVRSYPTQTIRVANDGGWFPNNGKEECPPTCKKMEETSEKMVSKNVRALILQIRAATVIIEMTQEELQG